MLKSEQNTERVMREIKKHAKVKLGAIHSSRNCFFEHGQWWVECLLCGAQWSVADCQDMDGNDYFDFEEVTRGDESCH